MTHHLQPPDHLEHAFILTMTPRSNGRRLRVRCRCMAEYRAVSLHYYNFDWLADVTSLEEARAVYQNHIERSEFRPEGSNSP